MLARLLAQARREPVQKTGQAVPGAAENGWYQGALRYLADRGVDLAGEDGGFSPAEPVTRGEFVGLAVRLRAAMGVPGLDGQLLQSLRAVFWTGQAEGGGAGFDPHGTVTRAQSVAALNRLLGRRPDRRDLAEHARQLHTFSDVGPDHWAWYDILEAANGRAAGVER